MPSIQHLRATAAVWEAYDAIIPEGELALLQGDGRVRIKVGDGASPFSALPFIDGNVRTSEDRTITLRTGDDVRLGSCRQLSLTLPVEPEDDFYAMVTFDSPIEAPTSLALSQAVTLSGDDTQNGAFVASGKRHYSLLLWNDGTLQGLVRGVDLA